MNDRSTESLVTVSAGPRPSGVGHAPLAMRARSAARALYLVGLLAVGGCGFIPMSGPASVDVRSQASPTLPYALVKLNPHVIQTLGRYEPNVPGGAFIDRRPPSDILFGVGDVLS